MGNVWESFIVSWNFNATPNSGNILFAKLITEILTKHLYAAYTNSSEIGLNKSWAPGHLDS